jgi:hypothetical protein
MLDRKTKKIIYIINVSLLIIFGFPILSYLLKSFQLYSSYYVINTFPQSDIFELKLHILKYVFLRISLLLFILILSTMFCRMFFFKNPIAKEIDPIVIQVLNRNISNLIENSFIFIILFTFYIFDLREELLPRGLAVGIIFLFARILFVSTYLLGTRIGFQQIRATGFGFNISVILLLFLENFKFPVFEFILETF